MKNVFNSFYRHKKIIIGMTAVLGYCLISAFSRVFASGLLQHQNPFAFCFYIFSWGTFIYFIIHINQLMGLFAKLQGNIKNVFYLNLSTLGSWLFLTYPLKYIEPAIVSTITFGIGPLLCLLLSKNFHSHYNRSLSDYIIAYALFFNICYIMQLCLLGKTAVLSPSFVNTVISLCCCIIVGISIVINSFQTKKLIHQGFSALNILSVRFILLIIAAGIITAHHAHHEIIRGFFNKNIIIASCLFVIFPLFLIQIGLRELEPITVAVMTPLMPIMTYFFEFHDKRLIRINTTLYAICVTLFLILLGTLLRYKKEKYFRN